MPEFFRLLAIEIAKRIKRFPAQIAVHAGWVAHVKNGVALRAALHALKDRWDKARAPAICSAARLHAAGNQHHKTGKGLVLRAESIRDPRTE
jgi:hypothetical protein